MPIEISSARFRDLQSHAGHIMFHVYTYLGKRKELAFSPIKPVNSDMQCSNCGQKTWNATNFVNLIHFCPNTVLEKVTITDHKINH